MAWSNHTYWGNSDDRGLDSAPCRNRKRLLITDVLLRIIGVCVIASTLFGCVDGVLDKPAPPPVLEAERALDAPPTLLEESNIDDFASDLLGNWGPVCGWFPESPGPLCTTPEQCAIVRCDLVELISGLIRLVMFLAPDGDESDLPPGEPPPPGDIEKTKANFKRREGFARVRKICPGYGSGDRANEANGTLELNVGFTNGGMDSTSWGRFNRCRYTTSPLGNIGIDGDVVVDIDDSESGNGPERMIIILDALFFGFGNGGQRIVGYLEQDYVADELKIYLPRLDRGVVFYKTPDTQGFRSVGQVVECDYRERRCVTDSGEVLQW
jgi:hypothetical protein